MFAKRRDDFFKVEDAMLKSLQACRAVAAILVVLFHASGSIFALPKYFGHKPFGVIFDFGFAGVDFFFVLSGFIMMHVHASDFGQPRALGVYLWKRFSRIYPVYWVVLAVILPIFFLVPQFGVGHERDPGVILRSIFLLPSSDNRMVLSVAWTLVFEVFFYLLFGLLILNKRIGVTVFLAWTGLILAYPWFDSYLSAFVFNNMNVRFLAGIAVALILARWEIPLPRLVACLGMAIFLATGLCEASDGPLSTSTQCVGYTLGSALMLAGLVQAERLGLIQPPNWLVYLGNASYSIYLVHFLGLSILAKIAKAAHLDLYLPGTVLFCLHVAGAIAIGCVFHHIVEKPIHTWAKRFFRRVKTSEPSVVVRQAA
jgi:exopolysaccharide production protein ExoZ